MKPNKSDLQKYFHNIFISQEVGADKPSPLFFQRYEAIFRLHEQFRRRADGINAAQHLPAFQLQICQRLRKLLRDLSIKARDRGRRIFVR